MRKSVLILLMLTVGTFGATAQQKPPTLTPPELQTFWSNSKGGTIPLELVLNMIDSTIWVIDGSKMKLSISRFMLVYRSRDRFEDEQTGEIKTRYNNTSVNIKNAGVPEEKWRKMLYENLKAGDEIWFTDIIVKDKRGNFFKAPDLKVVVN
ncbi:MAG: hypothetical protein HEQ40_04640 [Lacibacter sp.]|jgi:hypothetical protein